MIVNPYMFGGNLIVVNDATVEKNTTGSTAVATFKVSADGYLRNHAGTILGQWISVLGNASLYQVKATKLSGDTGQPSGTLGSYQACSADRSWSVTATVVSMKTATIYIEISDIATSTVRDTATIIINASAAANPVGPPGGGGGIEN